MGKGATFSMFAASRQKEIATHPLAKHGETYEKQEETSESSTQKRTCDDVVCQGVVNNL